ncbi:MAG TPA: hypothetical protein VHR84_14645 [Terriglobales bacterium]|jgi:hypothetical protein|nr:hypothetical protein [Terriglobales bacterium]
MTALTDEQLARAFADENRYRLSWLPIPNRPGHPHCWHWREGAMISAVHDESGAIARRIAGNFLWTTGEKITTERIDRILELAKKHMHELL